MARATNPDLLRFYEQASPIDELRAVSGVSKKTAIKILAAYPGGRDLANATIEHLKNLGATQRQAERIRSAFLFVSVCDAACDARVGGMPIRQPSDVAYYARAALGRKRQEMFMVIMLDARLRVIDSYGCAMGSIAHVDVHPRELFRPAVQTGAHSIIIVHNHPSGEADPSDADIQLTRRVADAGKLIGIPLLDHMIVTPKEHVSLSALGLVPAGNPKKRRSEPKTSQKDRRAIFKRMLRI